MPWLEATPCRTFRDHEAAIVGQLDNINSVESFLYCRWQKLFERRGDRGTGNFLPARSQVVSLHGIAQSGFEKVSYGAEARCLCGLNVAAAVDGKWIGVVDNKRLAALKTRSQEDFFAAARAQHIEVDSDMRVEETLAEEGAFARSLNPDKDDGFHRIAMRMCLENYCRRCSFGNLGGLGPWRIAEHTGS